MPWLQDFLKTEEAARFNTLTQGEFPKANLQMGDFEKRVRGMINRQTAEKPPPQEAGPFSPQKAQSLLSMGIPKSMVPLLASQTPPAHFRTHLKKFQKNAHSRFNQPLSQSRFKSAKSSRKSLKLTQARGLKKRKQENTHDFRKYLPKGKKGRVPAQRQMMIFSERAHQKAQVHGNKEKLLFQIISQRYKRSAWRKLQIH